ncbi:MAG: TIGR00159 family protein, partial [Muribaculaceae bacterium]|nr:TIGR00159 family protein [Muribaculaceae bacterium]
MFDFGIKDLIDIIIVALLLFYLYRMMKNSGTISLFYGVLAFIVIWVVAYEIFDMKLTGTILDKFMSIGLIVLVILFQDQIKRFLIDIGGRAKWQTVKKLFRHEKDGEESHSEVMSVVYA